MSPGNAILTDVREYVETRSFDHRDILKFCLVEISINNESQSLNNIIASIKNYAIEYEEEIELIFRSSRRLLVNFPSESKLDDFLTKNFENDISFSETKCQRVM